MKTCPNPSCTKSGMYDPEIIPDGDGQFSGGYHEWQVLCRCGMHGPTHDTQEGAEQLWNDLPRDPQVEKEHKNKRAKIEAHRMSQTFKPSKAQKALDEALSKISRK